MFSIDDNWFQSIIIPSKHNWAYLNFSIHIFNMLFFLFYCIMFWRSHMNCYFICTAVVCLCIFIPRTKLCFIMLQNIIYNCVCVYMCLGFCVYLWNHEKLLNAYKKGIIKSIFLMGRNQKWNNVVGNVGKS